MEKEERVEILRSVLVDESWKISGSDENLYLRERESGFVNQDQTNKAFSDKWSSYESSGEKERLYQMQRDWYLDLYGFENEGALSEFLKGKKTIFDAGCGLGYKAAWFAKLAPESLVLAMDFSDAVEIAAKEYSDLTNLVFVRGDIAETGIRDGGLDYVSCDQVIMHTEDPDATLSELARITSKDEGQLACYFYRKKSLPRELLDDHFRKQCLEMSREDLWEMSRQLTELGKRLSELNCKIDVPDIPALGIEGGSYDIQRFVYWNFLKCFFNGDLGYETSVITNFDWYSPSNARRYAIDEVEKLLKERSLAVEFFHVEKAAISGRFSRILEQ